MKYKRILAMVVIIVLLLLYISTVVFSLMDSPMAESLLLASLFCTVVLPSVMYGYALLIKYTKRDR